MLEPATVPDPAPSRITQQTFPGDLESLFRPRSIAIVGASNAPDRIGGVPLSLMIARGFRGRLIPVNPKYEVIQGLPAFPTLASVGETIDMAVVAVPAASLEATLEDAIAAGVKSLVIFSSGLAEIGAEGLRVQRRIAERAKAAGIRVLGPNCLGIMSFRENVFATFSPAARADTSRSGSIAVVSQSGAFGAYAYCLARARALGMSYWVTTGNEADVEFADCVRWLANDPDTRVILGYMEGCRDGRKLLSALECARAAGKQVVITKVGRSRLGSEAAASHTAALTGEDAVYDAMFRQFGVWRADSVDELFTVGLAASVCGLPRSGRAGVLTVSGGIGVLMADEAERVELDLAEMPRKARESLLREVPFANPRNPVDITGQSLAIPGLLERTLENMLASASEEDASQPAYGMVLIFTAAVLLNSARAEATLGEIIAARARHPDTAVMVTGVMQPEHRTALMEAGVAVVEDPTSAIRALGALAFFRRSFARSTSRSQPARSSILTQPSYTEYEALQLLASAGVPVVGARHAATSDDAVDAARTLGFPVAVKLSSREITHKTEVGGVRLGLQDERAVRLAYDEILSRARQAMPGAAIDGVAVAKMVTGGVECILGVQRDPVFGAVVMFGLGGTLVEATRDVSFRIAPVDVREARVMIDEIRTRAVLDGMRGHPPSDLDALAEAIARLSAFAVEQSARLKSLDINPFLVLPVGRGCVALDAVILTSDFEADGPHPKC